MHRRDPRLHRASPQPDVHRFQSGNAALRQNFDGSVGEVARHAADVQTLGLEPRAVTENTPCTLPVTKKRRMSSPMPNRN